MFHFLGQKKREFGGPLRGTIHLVCYLYFTILPTQRGGKKRGMGFGRRPRDTLLVIFSLSICNFFVETNTYVHLIMNLGFIKPVTYTYTQHELVLISCDIEIYVRKIKYEIEIRRFLRGNVGGILILGEGHEIPYFLSYSLFICNFFRKNKHVHFITSLGFTKPVASTYTQHKLVLILYNTEISFIK